jgi:peptidoglycan hydrolase-like protein with peptidoglycan-binding domain
VTRPLLAWTALAGLAACQSTLPAPHVMRLAEPEPGIVRATEGPPGAAPDSCWGRDVTPAVIETVTEQVMLQPAEIASDGTVLAPAVFKTETRQRITRERTEIWFEAPCPERMTRGFHRGAVTGEMDGTTRRAIRRYQQTEGLDSAVLSLAAARRLGLVEVDPATLD